MPGVIPPSAANRGNDNTPEQRGMSRRGFQYARLRRRRRADGRSGEMRDNDFGQPGEQARPGMPDQQGELAGQRGASPFPDQYGQPGVEPGQEPSLDRSTEGAMTDQYT